jgi:hypothetical protein
MIKLSDIGTVIPHADGVEVTLEGPVEKAKVEEMVAHCATGTAACCGPDFFAQVQEMDVQGEDGRVSIRLTGNVTPEAVQENLAVCDCYKG